MVQHALSDSGVLLFFSLKWHWYKTWAFLLKTSYTQILASKPLRSSMQQKLG